MIADDDCAQDFRTRAKINMVPDTWDAGSFPNPDSHLLQNQTVDANCGIRMDHDPIGVRHEQAATDFAIDRDIGAGDN